jgi:hypothetical protein
MVETPQFPNKHKDMVGGGSYSNRDPNVLVPTTAKKPQATPKILE